jgi:hypothetical protein
MDRDIADLQARVKILEENQARLTDSHDVTKIKVATSVAKADIKWWLLLRIMAVVGGVATLITVYLKMKGG